MSNKDFELNSYMEDFSNPDQWAGRRWGISFEDGSINALQISPLKLYAASKKEE